MVMEEFCGASLPCSEADTKKRRVTYFSEPTIGDYYYGQAHRIRMAHNLILRYYLHRRMEINCPFPAAPDDYVDFLASVTPDTLHYHTNSRHLKRFGWARTAPFSTAFLDSVRPSPADLSPRSSLISRMLILPSIVLVGCIMPKSPRRLAFVMLMTLFTHLLYIDIDIHDGDGIEKAFFTTDRIMTISFHKFGDFFLGTGSIKDVGQGLGKHYAHNVPLNDGMDGESFRSLFRPIICKVTEVNVEQIHCLVTGWDASTWL